LWEKSDAMQDYVDALYAWRKLNPRRK